MSLPPIYPKLFYRKSFLSFLTIRNLFLLYLVNCLGSCTSTTKDLSTIPSSDVILYKKILLLETTVADLPLRITPNISSELLEKLPKGTLLEGIAYSIKTIPTKRMNGINYTEPWQKVITEDGQTGWAYGGGLNLTNPIIPTVAQNDFLQKRLKGIFGTNLSMEIFQYRKTYDAIASSRDFATIYSKGLSLRDSVAQILSMTAEVVDPYEPADFSWLECTLPGFRIQLVAEATAYYPYIDYASFLKKANTTVEKEDDFFLHLNIAKYSHVQR